jgi:Ca-activated chloride channel homolog
MSDGFWASLQDLGFDQPGWFWWLIALVPITFMGLRWLVSMTRLRRWTAVIARLALIGLILSLLAGAHSVRETNRLSVVGVLDISGSVRRFALGPIGPDGQPAEVLQASRDFLVRALAERGPDDLAGLVVFDGRALAVAAPTRGSIEGRTIDVPGSEGTDLASAIRLAGSMLPADAAGRLVLISDGQETSGQALEAARSLVQRGQVSRGGDRGVAAGRVPIDVVPLTYVVSSETIVERVDAPLRASGESAVTVRVVLNSTDGGRGNLQLTLEGRVLDINGSAPGDSRPVTLAPGRHVELVRVELPPGRVHRFEAVWEPERAAAPAIDGGVEGAGARGAAGGLSGDGRLENNRAEAFTITPGLGSVLLVDGVGQGSREGAGATLARALERSRLQVDLVAPSGMPGDVLGLQAYDLVILQNVPAEELDESAQRALVSHVRDLGGGLVMIGGPDSLGPGGWKGSLLEPILPVKLDLPEQLVQPDAAVALVLDNSGSMRFGVMNSMSSQQEIANQAAALAVRTLDRKDLISIVTFNSDPTLLRPIGPNTDPKGLGERILAISPDGGTNLPPALQLARDQLASTRASLKHIIVLSDGRSMDADQLPILAREFRQNDGIRISAIAIGDAASETSLANMAREGGGSYYSVTNPRTLPKLFVKAIRVVRSPMIREGRFVPTVTASGSPLTAGVDSTPPLMGLVLTQPRPEPTITYAMLSPKSEPVLAHWPVELGNVAVFTSDAHHWAEPWLEWEGYQRLWTQISRAIGRTSSPTRFELGTNIEEDRLTVRLDAIGDDGRPVDLLTVPTTVYAPSGQAIEVSLSQVGPGQYEASLPAAQSGNYIAVVKPSMGTQRLAPLIGGTSVASGLEFRVLSDRRELLLQIAQETRGRVLDLARPESAGLFERDDLPPVLARTPLWRPLLLLAIVVMLLDVGTRRIAWDRLIPQGKATGNVGQATSSAIGRITGGRKASDGGASVALSDADAAAVARAARLDRQTRGRDVLGFSPSEQGSSESPGSSGTVITRPAANAEPAKAQPPAPIVDASSLAEGEGGLMAAKRRARQRLDE